MMFEKGESRHFSPFNPVLDVNTVISKFPVHQIEAQQWKDVVFTLSTSSGEIYKLLLQVVWSGQWCGNSCLALLGCSSPHLLQQLNLHVLLDNYVTCKYIYKTFLNK